MHRVERHDDVTRLILSTATSRAVGYAVSAYLAGDVMVDCGFPHVQRELEQFVRKRRIGGLILTHSHEDHAGNAALVARLGIPIAGGGETLEILRDAPPIELYRRVVWGQPEPLSRLPQPFESDRFRLIATPGHSSDHHVVFDEARETLFSGDLFVGVRVRVAHASEHPRAHVRSLRAIATLAPRRMFDAHRGPIERPAAALSAKADWMEEIIGRIERLFASGWTERAITRAVLGREALVHYFSAAHYSHLNFVRAVRRTMAGTTR